MTTPRKITANFERMRSAEYAYIRGTTLARAILQLAAACVLALLIWLAVARWDVSTAILLAFVALAVRAVPLVEALQISAQGWNQAAPALTDARKLIARGRSAGRDASNRECSASLWLHRAGARKLRP
jgi:ABC-type transport system involved in cytochrome bd biosynthesis fused ATPase/permease subunit